MIPVTLIWYGPPPRVEERRLCVQLPQVPQVGWKVTFEGGEGYVRAVEVRAFPHPEEITPMNWTQWEYIVTLGAKP